MASKNAPIEIHSDYLGCVYENKRFKTKVREVVMAVRSIRRRFDAIVFTGSSGAAMAYPVSFITGIPLLHVRKDKGHCWSALEGAVYAKRILFIDDFVDSGATLRRVRSCVKGKIVGVILYSSKERMFNEPKWVRELAGLDRTGPVVRL